MSWLIRIQPWLMPKLSPTGPWGCWEKSFPLETMRAIVDFPQRSEYLSRSNDKNSGARGVRAAPAAKDGRCRGERGSGARHRFKCYSFIMERLRLARMALDGLSVGDAFGERFFGSGAALIGSRAIPKAPWRWTDDTA